MKRLLDIDSWNRKGHYNMFKAMDFPYVNIGANLDITKFYHRVKEENMSFFKCYLYLVAKVANEIEEFRYRIEGEQVVIYDKVSPSFTLLNDDNTYSYCMAKFNDNFDIFYEVLEKNMVEVRNKESGAQYEHRRDLLYVTSIPWISFTNIMHPVSIKEGDSIPRIAIGKYFEEGNKLLIPFSVQVHHALMDGYHLGRYFELLQKELDNF